jgi:hypothetical protein
MPEFSRNDVEDGRVTMDFRNVSGRFDGDQMIDYELTDPVLVMHRHSGDPNQREYYHGMEEDECFPVVGPDVNTTEIFTGGFKGQARRKLRNLTRLHMLNDDSGIIPEEFMPDDPFDVLGGIGGDNANVERVGTEGAELYIEGLKNKDGALENSIRLTVDEVLSAVIILKRRQLIAAMDGNEPGDFRFDEIREAVRAKLAAGHYILID